MKKLGYCLTLATVIFLSACNGGDAEDVTPFVNQDEPIVSCLGFVSPGINVVVRDSLDKELVIDNATVQVSSTGESSSTVEFADFIADDDGLSNSEPRAYWTLLGLNESQFTIAVAVHAEGYHSAVIQNIAFELDTVCEADNTIRQEVYLCPLGTECI